MAGIVVKPRARILHGHDWVFSSEVLKVFGKPADGDVISLKDGKDHLIGSAIYNSKSQIVARRFSRRKQDLDLDFFKRRIAQAAEYRDRRGDRSKAVPRCLERKRRSSGRDHRSLRRPFRDANAHAGDGHAKGFDRRCDDRSLWTTSRSSNEMTRRFARRKDWNYAQVFCAECAIANRDRNRRRKVRSRSFARTKDRFLSRSKT